MFIIYTPICLDMIYYDTFNYQNYWFKTSSIFIIYEMFNSFQTQLLCKCADKYNCIN